MPSLKTLIHDEADAAASRISRLADAGRSHARRAGKSLRNTAADGQDLAEHLFDNTLTTFRSARRLAREKPAATAAAMIVGGLLVGGLVMLLQRRR